jgi:hypothetical protein
VRVQEGSGRILVNNERLKLLATFVNGLGIATFAVGALGPTISGLSRADTHNPLAILTTLICFLGALILHYLASIILKGLRT